MLIDVREVDEYRREHIAGASLVPTSAFNHESFPCCEGERPLLIYCLAGVRAKGVADALRASGRTNVMTVEGGIRGWVDSGLPTVTGAQARLPIMRQVMITAGTMLVGFTALAALVSPWFLIGTGFIGAGLAMAGVSGFCPMARLLSAMPWNRASKSTCASGPKPGAKPGNCTSCCG